MRNLKKILALVLALVMSLSLMATAGAKDFTDSSDIEATGYQTAVDVLAELEVVRGYENGSFQPNGDITRAEVAAIIYRIATKDVKDAQQGIYTTWGKFADVKDTAWYAGYVNYCANAEIVKGKTATTFDPEARITGYQVLAMILRTMGYGKNGEFEGSNWAINTAAQAKQIGIIDSILEQKLGSNATRAMVAEILFRALLTDTVNYNALTGYQSTGTNLGLTQFGLEKITGVVMANEYADLEDVVTLPDGKTRLNVDGKNYILNVTTDLTDIGESRTAYVRKGTQNTFNLVVDKLYDNGINVVAETGDATRVASLAATEGLSLTGAQYFVNFGDDSEETVSDYQITYQITKIELPVYTDAVPQSTAIKYLKDRYDITATVAEVLNSTGTATADTEWVYTASGANGWRISRAPGKLLTTQDMNCIRDIFYYAGLEKAATPDAEQIVLGEVYVGTQYIKDISDTYSYVDFYEEYLRSRNHVLSFPNSDNGDWLKIIDNNGDGIAEYVFDTFYGLAVTTGHNNRYDYFTYSTNGSEDHGEWDINLAPGNDDVNYLGDYEPAVGDLVLAAFIDGKWQIEKAPMETKTIKTVSYKDKTVTTTEDDTWNQSDEWNWTDYLGQILEMNEKTEYEIFFDHFGHIRAYREVAGQTSYALLSELYYTNNWNGKFIKNTNPIVEITMGDEDTVELLANGGNDFEGAGRTYVDGRNSYTDYLQRTISHLGHRNSGDTVNTNAYDSNIADKWVTSSATAGDGDEYVWTAAEKVSETNVAAYALSDDGESVSIGSASVQYVDHRGDAWYYSDIDANGDGVITTADKVTEDSYLKLPGATAAKFALLTPVYAVDYVQLAIENLKKGASAYTIDEADVSAWDRGNVSTAADKAAWKGNYVNAVHDTEYYIVGMGDGRSLGSLKGIRHFTDYKELPAIDADDITAIYAVATNTTADKFSRDYWVADVIVIETTGQVKTWDSVALTYYNPLKTTGNVRDLDSLDSETVDPEVTLVPKDQKSWGDQWTNYWFYDLYDTEVAEPSVAAGYIDKVVKDYNDHGIYAGVAVRSVEVLGRGSYVMVDQGTEYAKNTRLVVGEVPVYGVVVDSRYSSVKYPEYSLVELSTSEIRSGDELIWVCDQDGTLKYIVISNLGYNTNHSAQLARNEVSPSWLARDLYDAIIADQNHVDAPETERIKIELETVGTQTIEIAPITDDVTWDNVNSELVVPADSVLVQFKATPKNGAVIGAISFRNGWEKHAIEAEVDAAGAATGAYIVTIVKMPGRAANDGPEASVEPIGNKNVIATTAYIKAEADAIKAIADAIKTAGTMTEEQEAALAIYEANMEIYAAETEEVKDAATEAGNTAAATELTGTVTKADEAADAIVEAEEAVEAAEAEADERLTNAKNTALEGITKALNTAEPYWISNLMGWKALKAEVEDIMAEIEEAKNTTTIDTLKAQALAMITAPATVSQATINAETGASAALYEVVEAVAVPGENKIIISTETAPTGYTMTQLLASDELIKAALAWNDAADEVTGAGTTESPWETGNEWGTKYIKGDTDQTGFKAANKFIRETLGAYLLRKDSSFTDTTKLFFAVLDTEAAGIEGVGLLLAPITQGMLDANGVYTTGIYGHEGVTLTVDCSGIQW